MIIVTESISQSFKLKTNTLKSIPPNHAKHNTRDANNVQPAIAYIETSHPSAASRPLGQSHAQEVVRVSNLTFTYAPRNARVAAAKAVCHDLSLSIFGDDIACLLGPSGCGKTTVLRCIAGLNQPQQGSIALYGETVTDTAANLNTPTRDRGLGMVFQDYALFPHLTIEKNIAFGLSKMPTDAQLTRVSEMLELVQLRASARAYPHEISGGQRQRVALARALAPRPKLMLLDEPFSNLDVSLREELGLEVRAILKSQHVPALLVTHDQHEAFSIADKIGVMHNGAIEQWASAYNLYHRPATRFVADFVGQGVLLKGRMNTQGLIDTELGPMRITEDTSQHFSAGSNLSVLVRPDDILHDDASPEQARVLHKAFRGADILYTLKLGSGATVLSLVPSHHNHEIGQLIGIKLEIDHVVAFAD